MLRNVWSLILAAESGPSLQKSQNSMAGLNTPKQYCSLGRSQSFVQSAIQRARALTDLERIVAVVGDEHRLWWQSQLSMLSDERIVVQPQDRGSAAAILMPLLRIHALDPEAIVLTMPSEQIITEEEVVIRAMEAAVEGVQCHPEKVILLGMQPENPDPDYGWIVPARRRIENGHLFSVDSFVDRPSSRFAEIMFNRGGLWNSLIFAATVENLLRIYSVCLPELFRHFEPYIDSPKDWRQINFDILYSKAPPRDFACDILESCERFLGVIPVRSCGWTELTRPAHWALYQQHCSKKHHRQENRSGQPASLQSQGASFSSQTSESTAAPLH